jgi:hypothetical protein
VFVSAIFSHLKDGAWRPQLQCRFREFIGREEGERIKHLREFSLIVNSSSFINCGYTIYRIASIITVMITVLVTSMYTGTYLAGYG